MQSVITDCPHRGKLSWLEQDYLMGASIRYNFDIYQLFDKAFAAGSLFRRKQLCSVAVLWAFEKVCFYATAFPLLSEKMK